MMQLQQATPNMGVPTSGPDGYGHAIWEFDGAEWQLKKNCAAEFHTIWVPYLQSFEHVLLRTLPECSCFEDERLLDELFPGSSYPPPVYTRAG